MASISGVIFVTSGMKLASGFEVGIGRVQAVNVGEQHQAIGARHLRHARGQPIVVAVADLGRGNRVVLVDDRDRAETQQRRERIARIQVTPPHFGIAERQQHLCNREVMLLEHFLPRVREANLPDRGRGLAFLQLEFPGSQAELTAPERDRPGGNQHDLLAALAQRGDIRRQRLEPGAVQPPRRTLHEQRRADLDDDSPGLDETRTAARSRAVTHATAHLLGAEAHETRNGARSKYTVRSYPVEQFAAPILRDRARGTVSEFGLPVPTTQPYS